MRLRRPGISGRPARIDERTGAASGRLSRLFFRCAPQIPRPMHTCPACRAPGSAAVPTNRFGGIEPPWYRKLQDENQASSHTTSDMGSRDRPGFDRDGHRDLSFVHVTASIEPSKRCAPSIWQSQWPKWIGCTMAAHEGLAGGLIGGAGALFAAWVAYTAVRDQIDAEGERVREQIDAERRQAREQLAEEERQRLQQHAEAKEVALVVITQPVHAAATALAQIDDALRIGQVGHIQTDADRRVDLAIAHVKGALESFTVRESVRDLAVHDRVLYLLIVSTLSTFVNVTINQSPFLSRGERLQAHRRALMRLHAYLGPFDTQLAQVFARDSATTPNP